MSRAAQKPSRGTGLSVLALIVALVAGGLAGWSLARSSPTASKPDYTNAQRTDARAKACTAYLLVRSGVARNTNQPNPGGADDPTGALAVAANARLALLGGGQYLLARLDAAAPLDLAKAVRTFANMLMDIGAAATAGSQTTDPDQTSRLQEADKADSEVQRLCK